MSTSYSVIAASDLDPALIEAWRSIQSASRVFPSPYFCPEFTQLAAGVRSDVRIAVIENGGRAVGFLPYQRSRWGIGRPVGGALSDYHGVVVRPEAEWSLDALLRAARLSVWTFDHLVDGSGLFEPHVTRRDVSPQIDLAGGYERYVAGRRESGSDYVRKTEGLARKLEREVGALRFALHDPSTSVINQLMHWKSDQYRRAGRGDVFGTEWTGRLLRSIAGYQAPAFAGLCSTLRAGERLVAAHMGMRSNEVLHYWFPAYDPEFARYSTGIILLLRIAEAAAAGGLRALDLGKGEAQYKQRLMNGAVELCEGYVERQSLAASARRLMRAAEARAARGGIATALRLPLGAMRRLARARRFR